MNIAENMISISRVGRALSQRSVRAFSCSVSHHDTPTHTGQTFEANDVR